MRRRVLFIDRFLFNQIAICKVMAASVTGLCARTTGNDFFNVESTSCEIHL